MKGVIQGNLFGSKRIEFNEQIELTVQSMQTYGPLYKHWAFAWSMGKDSTTALTLIIQLIQTGQITAPESITVLRADTRQEILPLWLASEGVVKKLAELGISVKTVMAPLDERFLVYMLGRGIAPPSTSFRWCTQHMKILPMKRALEELFGQKNERVLLITGVRQGESAIRDGRIAMSCGKDGAECGQGWYQEGMDKDFCDTLAPLLHWRVCSIWDWLKIFAPNEAFGQWPTAILADAYGGDEAEEINARTGCICCPLAKKDKALDAVIKLPEWAYLAPLKELKLIYREMKHPRVRLRKDGEFNKDGSRGKKPQRLGPLTLKARLGYLDRILKIQQKINTRAVELGMPSVDFLNKEEEDRIRQLISEKTWPQRWDGTEVQGDVILNKRYPDGTILKDLYLNQ